ncbi:hypothetical protein AMAG_02869 [Allomyces macrogynus ATCC 38327]|uniref:Uncharacterized protein n=1 Tax=Allomyces macrogynus (strain ATCC 38327) TaxID=578462 RepID=A0A0L0S426_ALLM3|nr:hypothetical protein AMAG_02869 [Allomyces macrogynus ATCC 38327]|eukprot:KNE57119.1 hypothetical protein AMAG_02869 [Allomyces macrogynus ATCC 38327]
MPRFFALSPNSPRASLSSNPATLSARSSRRPTPDLAASAEALRARLGPAAILSSTSSTASLAPAAASRSASVDVLAPAPQLSLGLGDLSLGGLDDALLALHLDNEDTPSWNPPAFYGQDAVEAPMRPSTSSARPSADHRVSSPRTSPVLRSPLPFPTLPPLSPLPPSPFPAVAPVSSPRRTRREPSPAVRARNVPQQPRSMSSDLTPPRRTAAPAADAPPRLSRQRSQSENAASIASDLDRLALQLSLGFSDPPALHLALPNAPPSRTRSPAPPTTRTSTSTRPVEAPIPLALPLLDLTLQLSPPPPLTPQLADRRTDSGSDVADARPPSRPRMFLRPPIDHPARTSASAPPLSNTSDPRDLPVLPTLAPRLSEAGDAERRPSIRVPQVRPRDRAPPPTRPSLDPDATSPPPPVSRPSVSTTPAPLPLELPHLDTDLVRRRQSRFLAPAAAGDSGAPAISDMDDFDDGDSIARDVRILARDPAPPYRDPAAPFLLELDAYGRPRTTPTLVPDLDVTQAIISLMQLHYIPPAAGGATAAAPSRRSVHLPTLLAQAAAPAPGIDESAGGNAWTLLGHESVKDKAYVCFNGSHLATLVLGDPERRAPAESVESAAESSMPMASVLPLIPRSGFLFEQLSLDQKPAKPAEPIVTFYLAVENRTISMSPTERACARQIIEYVNAERARLGFPDAPGPAPPLDADDGSTLVSANATSPRRALRPAPRDASLHISIPRHMLSGTNTGAPQTPPPNYDDLDGPGGSRSPPWRRRSRGRRIEAMAGPRQVARSASRRSSVYSRRSTTSSMTGGGAPGSPRPHARSPVAAAIQEHRRSMPPPARWSMVETAAEPMHLPSAADGVEGAEEAMVRPWVVSSFSDVGVATDAPGEPAPAPTRRDVDLRVAPWEAIMPPPMPMPPVSPIPADEAVAIDATTGAPRDRTSRAFMPAARSPFRAPATLSGTGAGDDTSALSPMLSPLSLSGTFPSSVPQTTRAFSPSPRPRADVPLHRTASPPGRRGTNGTAPTPRGASKFFRRMLSVLEGASPPPPPAAAPAPAAPAARLRNRVPMVPWCPCCRHPMWGEPAVAWWNPNECTFDPGAPGTPSDLASPGAWSLNGSTVVRSRGAAASGVSAARPTVSSVGRR